MQSPGAARAEWRHADSASESSESSFERDLDRDWDMRNHPLNRKYLAIRRRERVYERDDDLHHLARQQVSAVGCSKTYDCDRSVAQMRDLDQAGHASCTMSW